MQGRPRVRATMEVLDRQGPGFDSRMMDISQILLAAAGVGLGGFLKGATGAGTPIVGVPVLTLVLGLPEAVAIFSVLNLVTNIWQAWQYRSAVAEPRLARDFALAGGAGALLGSLLLAALPVSALTAGLAVVVFLYIGLRLARPDWVLGRALAARWAWLAGAAGGVMQGAGGLSSPASITFLSAMRMPRPEFIGTISVFFVAMSVVQVPTLLGLGLLDAHLAGLAVLALGPIVAAMPVGAWVARRIPQRWFDRAILILLAAIALRLLWKALA